MKPGASNVNEPPLSNQAEALLELWEIRVIYRCYQGT